MIIEISSNNDNLAVITNREKKDYDQKKKQNTNQTNRYITYNIMIEVKVMFRKKNHSATPFAI